MQEVQPTLLAQTVRIALRLAMVWAGGFVFAVILRILLPEQFGIPIPGQQTPQMIPYSRIGFWTCLLAALTVSAMIVIRTMLVDLGLRAPR
jgi:hypothetical protein